jgi:hypothetical protein
MVFYGCAAIASLNFLMLLTYEEVDSGGERHGGPWDVMKVTFRNFANVRLVVFVLIMSGYWVMYNQLFDLLPNFIVDWVDSSSVVASLNVPAFMLQYASERGPQMAQEWMINANGALIILAVVPLSLAVTRVRRVVSITAGIAIGSVGLFVAGWQMSGWVCLGGILLFSAGEMLASPKMNEYLGVIAPTGQKGLYMGYAQVPLAIGWGSGSLMGGGAYDRLGDKANLAIDYLSTRFNMTGVPRTEAFARLVEVTQSSPADATTLLWNTYQPSQIWYQFMAIGLAAAVGMLLYSRWVRRFEAANA